MSGRPPTRRLIHPRATFIAFTFTSCALLRPALLAAWVQACAADSLATPFSLMLPMTDDETKPIFQRFAFAGESATVTTPSPPTTFRPPKACWKLTACEALDESLESAMSRRPFTELRRNSALCLASQPRAAMTAVAPVACLVRNPPGRISVAGVP